MWLEIFYGVHMAAVAVVQAPVWFTLAQSGWVDALHFNYMRTGVFAGVTTGEALELA